MTVGTAESLLLDPKAGVRKRAHTENGMSSETSALTPRDTPSNLSKHSHSHPHFTSQPPEACGNKIMQNAFSSVSKVTFVLYVSILFKILKSHSEILLIVTYCKSKSR